MLRQLPTRAVGAIAALLILLLALLPQPTSGDHVEPVYVDYSATCSDLSPGGVVWYELQISSVQDGTYARGPLTVSLEINQGDNVTTIDWSSNIGVDGVFVKGGPGGNFYYYGAAANGDTGLTAPLNPSSGKHFNPNHLLFCTTTPLVTVTPTLNSTATLTPTPTVTLTPTVTGTPLPTPTAPTTATLTATPTATALPGTATPTPDAVGRLYFPAICNICFDLAGEPNNSCAAAYPIQPNTPHAFYAEDDDDWYRFVLEFAADIEIRVTNFVPLEGQVAAYNGDRCDSAHLLGNYGKPGLEKTLSLGHQPAGTYFVYVSNDGEFNTTDAYGLVIDRR